MLPNQIVLNWIARSAFVVALGSSYAVHAQSRVMQPEDLFRTERIGAIAWSPNRRRATVELPRPGRWIDLGLPTSAIAIVDVATATIRTISSPSRAFIGFFGAKWSPDSRRLLFLSVDTNAVVRPWLWNGSGAATLLSELRLRDGLADPPVALWSGNTHAVFMVPDSAARLEGPLYVRINRGRNSADAWRRARRGESPAVSVVDSRGPQPNASVVAGMSRIVSVDLETYKVITLARGPLHKPRVSSDGRTITFMRENPPLSAATVASFLSPDAHGEAVYDKPNWGSEIHHIDARTGAETASPDTAQRLTRNDSTGPILRVVSTDSGGSTLVFGRPGKPDVHLWRGNLWTRDVLRGRAEAIVYSTSDGTRLTGWLLYPPRHITGQKLPIITVVYPGSMYTQRVPSSFNILQTDFEHPQLFAALGYGVLLPSMPADANPLESTALNKLMDGVMPLLDTLIARGIADSTRIAVIGQSAGGFATIGLITQTHRFRTAIASASYANLASLYGTFYGQFRYGDAGNPARAQILRILQFERGFFGAGAPPWEMPERYRANSPIWQLGNAQTPLLLIHGELDFIPIQQAEEVFTTLYRQDKRVRLVRYAGEEHTITSRANVLDLWRQFGDWLRETMATR